VESECSQDVYGFNYLSGVEVDMIETGSLAEVAEGKSVLLLPRYLREYLLVQSIQGTKY
jgi:hypothetical protein